MNGWPAVAGADAKLIFNLNCQEGQMHSSLIAVVLCISAQAAGAQCVATAGQAAPDTRQGVDRIKTHVVTAPPMDAALRPGAELITTAAAGARDGAPVMRESPPASAQPVDDEDHPRHAGPAMLLAALALMSGIALRRYGANDQ
jgi:hypothetical protein